MCEDQGALEQNSTALTQLSHEQFQRQEVPLWNTTVVEVMK